MFLIAGMTKVRNIIEILVTKSEDSVFCEIGSVIVVYIPLSSVFPLS